MLFGLSNVRARAKKGIIFERYLRQKHASLIYVNVLI